MKTSVPFTIVSSDSFSVAGESESRLHRYRGLSLVASASLLLSAFALSGCTPGVDSDVSEDDEEEVGTSEDAVTSCGTLAGDDITANDKVKAMRTDMGLPAMSCDSKVRAAARKHSAYMTEIGQMTHTETVTTAANFTGKSAGDRMKKQGYTPGSWSEDIAGGGSAGPAIDLWIDSVFHRVPFMNYKTTVYGFGRNGSMNTMDFDAPSSAANPPSNKQWFYPKSGATGVKTKFCCKCEGGFNGENACPAGGASPAGYPVSLMSAGTLVVQKATFRKNGSTSSVPFSIEVNKNTSVTCTNGCDSQTKFSKDAITGTNVVFLVPKSALAASTKYNIVIGGTDGGTAFTKSWSFTTGS